MSISSPRYVRLFRTNITGGDRIGSNRTITQLHGTRFQESRTTRTFGVSSHTPMTHPLATHFSFNTIVPYPLCGQGA